MTRNEKKVKKISLSRLRNVALWYLERFGGTRARVRQILDRRIQEAAQKHGPTPEAADWREQVLEELQSLGHINDAAFATSRVQKGMRQGKSRKLIIQDLRRAGVEPEAEHAALAILIEQEGDSELQAAQTYVRQRRLGAYRVDPDAYRDKDMARLARRGFSYQIARQALEKDEA